MSLLHLGAQKVLSNNDEQEKPKKNKDGSFLVHFKIPYIVTPVKEKPKAKKYHHKHIKKPHHLKKYHHRVLHHKHHKHHHHHHHHPHVLDASKPAPQATYNPQTPGWWPTDKILTRTPGALKPGLGEGCFTSFFFKSTNCLETNPTKSLNIFCC